MLENHKEDEKMKKGTLRQILLMTDGCSNQGEDPTIPASIAYSQGVVVNVIGILDDQSENPTGLEEVEAIAASGGGLSQLVYQKDLSQTVQMVTKQAMTQTIQGFINTELKQILGKEETMEDMEPEKRGEMMEMVEDLEEKSHLEILFLIDTSASMHDKLETVKEALLDLAISLNARMGENRFSMYRFPGQKSPAEKVLDWTPKLDSVSSIFPKLTSRGITPTGPALREALRQFSQKSLMRDLKERMEVDPYDETAWD